MMSCWASSRTCEACRTMPHHAESGDRLTADPNCLSSLSTNSVRHNRHSLATFLVESGTDPVVVQKMLRQSNVDTTMIYIHNAKKAREAQGQFMKRFMPSGVKSRSEQNHNGCN
jgi:hypothetical protein